MDRFGRLLQSGTGTVQVSLDAPFAEIVPLSAATVICLCVMYFYSSSMPVLTVNTLLFKTELCTAPDDDFLYKSKLVVEKQHKDYKRKCI